MNLLGSALKKGLQKRDGESGSKKPMLEHFGNFGAMSFNGFNGPLLKLFHHNIGPTHVFLLLFHYIYIIGRIFLDSNGF